MRGKGGKRTACAVAYYRPESDGEEDRDSRVVEDGFREGEVRDVGCHCCGEGRRECKMG